MLTSDSNAQRAVSEAWARARRRPSFKVVLYLAIIPVLVVTVSFTGWLSFQSGRQSAEELAHLLRVETTERIQNQLANYLKVAPLINQLNGGAIASGQLQTTDLLSMEERFGTQVGAFEWVNWIAFGREADGSCITFERMPDGEFRIETSVAAGPNEVWSVGPDMNRHERMSTGSPFDPRQRPWYRTAVTARAPSWTEVFGWFELQALCIDAVTPVYADDGSLIGVLEAGFALDQVSSYLGTLELGDTGRTFIVDSQGYLVASSSEEELLISDGTSTERVHASQSIDPLIRAAFDHVATGENTQHLLGETTDLEFENEGGRVFLRSSTLELENGPEWALVTVIAERDFMGPFYRNARRTVVFSLAALLFAILAAVFTVKWLTRPIRDLTMKARLIQEGDLSVHFLPRARDEIGTLTRTMSNMVVGLRQRERMRDAFGRYVSPELAEKIASKRGALELGGELKKITILMSDLRGFSGLSERLGPRGMIGLLNNYLGTMSEVIVAHGGMINEFIGDAILVFFGLSSSDDDDSAGAESALRCAIGMQRAMLDFAKLELFEDLPPLEMGIGVHTGEAIVGNIGSEDHVKFGAVGEAINLTARIESLTVGGQVLVSQDTTRRVKGLSTGPVIEVQVKGSSRQLVVVELRAVNTSPRIEMPPRIVSEDTAVDFEADLYTFDGKKRSVAPAPARIQRIGPKRVSFTTKANLTERTNIALEVDSDELRDKTLLVKINWVGAATDEGETPYTGAITSVVPRMKTDP